MPHRDCASDFGARPWPTCLPFAHMSLSPSLPLSLPSPARPYVAVRHLCDVQKLRQTASARRKGARGILGAAHVM
jgi:hypothetical protein